MLLLWIFYKVMIFKPVNKIKSTRIGVTNRKILKTTLSRNTFEIVFSLVRVCLNLGHPHTQPTKILIAKPPTGSNTLEVEKSQKSKAVMPKILKFARVLFDNADKDPTNAIPTTVTRVAHLRFNLVMLIKKATTTSTRDSMAPMAANAVKIKKRIMKIWPKGIALNTVGMVMNSSSAPAVGSILKANTAGKMAMPASSDTNKSAPTTLAALAGMF